MEPLDAFRHLLAAVPSRPRETVALDDACGRVLAGDLIAPHDVPPFSRAAMDGYAVRAQDVAGCSPEHPLSLRVTGRSAMGDLPTGGPGAGEAWEIATGAPMPSGADAVVPVEWTRRAGGAVLVRRPANAGRNVGPAGEDLRRGQVALRAGTPLRAQEVAIVAALGLDRVEVIPPPRVALVSTGDELVPPGAPLRPGTIYNSTLAALIAEVRHAGGRVTSAVGCVPDDEVAIARAIEDGLREAPDVLLTTGGVSVGTPDLLPEVWRRLGAEKIVGRIGMKPGGPFFAGRLGSALVISLSGSPAACLTAYHLLVRPCLLRLAGRRAVVRPLVPVVVVDGYPKPADVTRVLWARLEGHSAPFPASLRATQRPGVLSTLALANGIIILPRGSGPLARGDRAWALRTDWPEEGETLEIPQASPAAGGGPPAVSIVGHAEVGKTTLVEGLLRHLAARGVRAAAVKHASHGFDAQVPQKDSARLRRAGAEGVAVVGPGGLLWMEEGEPALADLLAFLGSRPCDLILVEGYKEGPLPKVEVLGAGDAPALTPARGLIAVVAREAGPAGGAAPTGGVPWFRADDLEGLLVFLLTHLRVPSRTVSR
ncbi:MAG: molybdopterin-guanine dinucleotide biosynthesis protein B [Armatimonadetes bacterium]|nr:molybdopterin-guanine dinucleotide biosynthesis protein B [Armatimonadota bacterium]